ncbi:MAG: LysM peptidoglycan-binding domain-containing protein, partial [Methylococcales bacterium]
MVFRTTIGFIIPLLLSINALAEDIALNPSHPEQYTVTQGDTLWDISGKFLRNPRQWPTLWNYNQQINNPHLIYPGDTIYFSVVNGQPRLSFSKTELLAQQPAANSPCVLHEEEFKNGRASFAVDEQGKVTPCIRETNLKKAITLLPTETIKKYLTLPRVVNEKELAQAPYVIGFAGEHLVAASGDKVYVRSIIQPQNLAFTIYRTGTTYTSPETGAVLGYEAKDVGMAVLEKEGDPATLVIKKAKNEIRNGDRIMSIPESDIELNYFPRPPEKNISGSIISVFDGVQQIGQYNVVIIDKGSADGLLAGHELTIYKRGSVVRDQYSAIENDTIRLPDEIAGSLMVFR